MNPATSSPAAERLLSPEEYTQTSKPVEHNILKPRRQVEADAERIKSSVSRLTSSSIEGLEGLASELQQLQLFLKGEIERVQSEIESALAGINIIVETIAPWKMSSVPIATGTRAVRTGPAANIESVLSRR